MPIWDIKKVMNDLCLGMREIVMKLCINNSWTMNLNLGDSGYQKKLGRDIDFVSNYIKLITNAMSRIINYHTLHKGNIYFLSGHYL